VSHRAAIRLLSANAYLQGISSFYATDFANSVKLLGHLTQMVPPSACFYHVISAKLCSRVESFSIRWMGSGKVGEWLLGFHSADVLHRRRFVFRGIYPTKGGELSEIMLIFAKYRCVFWSDAPYM
jgi:hypothetical protein